MSYATRTHQHPAGSNAFGWAAAAWRSVTEFFVLLEGAIGAAEDYNRLSRMSDSQLAAKGMTRTDIPARVFKKNFSI